MTHDQLYEYALQQINKLMSDTSVSQEQTAESLVSLKEEIDELLDSLEIEE